MFSEGRSRCNEKDSVWTRRAITSFRQGAIAQAHQNDQNDQNDCHRRQKACCMERESGRMPESYQRHQERQQMRTNKRRVSELGGGMLRAVLSFPLLDTEVLALDVHHAWYTLVPDAEDAEDADAVDAVVDADVVEDDVEGVDDDVDEDDDEAR